MEKSIKARSARGLVWSAIDYFSKQGIQLVISFVIARLLSPSDYGLVAMVWIFIDIANKLIDSGFSNALIQKKNRTQTDLSTVFFFNVLVSVTIYAIIFIGAPYVSQFYQIPELTFILRVMSLMVVINSFGIVHKTILTYNLDFKSLAKVSVSSALFSGIIAIYLAYYGYGVWALVCQQIILGLSSLPMLWLLSSWHPDYAFSGKSFRELFGFGSKLMIGALIHSVYNNLYSLIIGKVFNASQLGFYNRAHSIAQLPSDNITNVFDRVAYPIECELQNKDLQMKETLYRFIQMASYILFPVMLCLVVIATPLIKLTLTEKWLPCVPYFQLICIANMFLPIMRMNWSFLNAKHRSDYSLQSEFIKKIVAFSIMFALYRFGVLYMCIGMILYSLSDWFIVTRYTKKVIPDVNMWTQFRALCPIFIISAISVVGSSAVLIVVSNSWLQLFIGTVVFFLSYAVMSKLFNRSEFANIINFLKKVI